MGTEPALDLRYSAHLGLAGIGAEGQARIGRARVLVIGLGGLGGVAAQYLCSSGAGALGLCDFDRVERSNLARQWLYTEADIGHHKTDAAATRLGASNPATRLRVHARRFDQGAARVLEGYDLVLDASDNYGTRLAVNQAARAAGMPWIMGSCIRFEGQLILFTSRAGEPCYRCWYGEAPNTLEDCPGAGVFSPVAGVIGSAMAHLALLWLATGQAPSGLHLFDGAHMTWRTLNNRRRANCPVCSAD